MRVAFGVVCGRSMALRSVNRVTCKLLQGGTVRGNDPTKGFREAPEACLMQVNAVFVPFGCRSERGEPLLQQDAFLWRGGQA